MVEATEPLTAHELAALLLELPKDTTVTWTEHDYDGDMWFSTGFRGVSPDGDLLYACIVASGPLWEAYEDEDEDLVE